MSSTECLHSPDSFCYVCGEFISSRVKKCSISDGAKLRQAYQEYFGLEIKNQDKYWVPHFVCQSCAVGLLKPAKDRSARLKFDRPRIWSQPTSHQNDCYFCLAKIFRGRNLNIYPNIPSSQAPTLYAGPSGSGLSRTNVSATGDARRVSTSDMEEQQVAAAEQIVDHTSENVASSVNQKLRPVDNGKPEMLWRSDDCNHHPDDFCYICGYFITRTTTKHTLRKDTKLYEAYKQYFNIEVEHQDKQWVPHYACHNCTRRLHGWYQGENRLMEFAVPRIWHSPSNHQTDCYFCVVNLASGQKKSTYPDIPSSRAPIPHSAERPIPQRTCETAVSTTTISTVSGSSVPSSESLQLQGGVLNIPHYPNQTEINDLIRDLALPKNKSELLLSRLKQWSLLDESVRITSQRTRDEEFSSYYTSEDGICFCRDIEGLFSEIGIPLIVRDWRLFIDGSSKSLKVVLLHNRVKSEQYPSLPIAHSILLKESYATTKLLFNKIQYEKFGWEVIGDFKMIGFLIGLQGGYTKFPCFLCLWDSRDTENHYKIKNWEIRAQYKIGEKNVKNDPVVNMEKILMPPLHIKLGLIKQFVKALNKDSESFKFITKLFPKLSEAKITAGVFTGPQVKKLIKSESFPKLLNEKEKAAWKSFRDIVQGFLGNNRDPRYEAIVHELMKNFETMGCRMSLKVHILHSHLDKFKENMGVYSEEQGERFHQDIKHMEQRYQCQATSKMMGDYVWSLMRDTTTEYTRQPISKLHF